MKTHTRSRSCCCGLLLAGAMLLLPVALLAAELAGKEKEAYESIYKKALKDDPKSQSWLAELFRFGKLEVKYEGTELIIRLAADLPKAVTWYRRAAELGDLEAAWQLAHMHRRGEGVEKSGAEAAKWFKQADGKGERQSAFYLGLLYSEGEGVAKNMEEAVRWYSKAATNGVPEAMLNLALIYVSGEGVARDPAQAAVWLTKADAKAADNSTALRGDICFALGRLHAKGDGVPKDEEQAVKWYKKGGLEHGDTDCMLNLAVLYFTGPAAIKNDREAYKWFHLASKLGNAAAQKNLEIVKPDLKLDEIEKATAEAEELHKKIPVGAILNSLRLNLPKPKTDGAGK